MTERTMHQTLEQVNTPLAIAGVLSPAWFVHAMDWWPSGTTIVTTLSAISLFIGVLDRFGLIPNLSQKRKQRSNENADHQ